MATGSLPQHIGKYEVLRLLGSGGMGRVFLARDPDIGREVAIKQVTLADDPQARQRFVLEAQTMGRLNHPNITTLLEFGTAGADPYLVLELLSGEDLSAWLRRPHRLREQLQVMLDIAQGIDAAHRAGVLHRDLKPDNVRVLDNGRCKLLDFGIAHAGGEHLTASGFFVGTPEFVAPEVMSGAAHTAAGDLYALGLLFYVIVTGENPMRADTIQATVARIVQFVPPPLHSRVRGLPKELGAIIQACLSKQPEQRPDSANDLVSVLRQCLEHTSADAQLTALAATRLPPAATRQSARTQISHAAPTSAPPKRALRSVSVAVALAVVVALGWVLWPTPPVPESVTAAAPAIEQTPVTEPVLEPTISATRVDPVPADLPIATTDRPTEVEKTSPDAAPQTRLEPASTTDKPIAAAVQTSQQLPKPTPEPIAQRAAQTRPVPAPERAPVVVSPSALPPIVPTVVEATSGPVAPPPGIPPVAAEPLGEIRVTRMSPTFAKTGRTLRIDITGTGLAAVQQASVQSAGRSDARFVIDDLQHDGDTRLSFSLAIARGVPLGSYAVLLEGKTAHSTSTLLKVSL